MKRSSIGVPPSPCTSNTPSRPPRRYWLRFGICPSLVWSCCCEISPRTLGSLVQSSLARIVPLHPGRDPSCRLQFSLSFGVEISEGRNSPKSCRLLGMTMYLVQCLLQNHYPKELPLLSIRRIWLVHFRVPDANGW